MTTSNTSGYAWNDAELSDSHSYLLPVLQRELDKVKATLPADSLRLFELGCGNGSVAAQLSKTGWNVTGVDPSSQGIARANRSYPELKLYDGSAYDDLSGRFGQFPVVTSLEVVEHVYAPRDYARTLFNLVQTGGTAIISTPYHGYWKNLALAASGKMDTHFTALWDHGHIKFWSIDTLNKLLVETGFKNIRFERAGRIPALAKSMIAIARKL